MHTTCKHVKYLGWILMTIQKRIQHKVQYDDGGDDDDDDELQLGHLLKGNSDQYGVDIANRVSCQLFL